MIGRLKIQKLGKTECEDFGFVAKNTLIIRRIA
jgi:hypothetical protein